MSTTKRRRRGMRPTLSVDDQIEIAMLGDDPTDLQTQAGFLRFKAARDAGTLGRWDGSRWTGLEPSRSEKQNPNR